MSKGVAVTVGEAGASRQKGSQEKIRGEEEPSAEMSLK